MKMIWGNSALLEIFKQFLPKNRSTTLAATWAGDRYAIFENQKNKRTLLEFRVRLASDADAARFFGAYSELLELKYGQRDQPDAAPEFLFLRYSGGRSFSSLHGCRLFRSRGRHARDVRSLHHGNGMAGRARGSRESERTACQSDGDSRFTRGLIADAGQPTLPTAP